MESNGGCCNGAERPVIVPTQHGCISASLFHTLRLPAFLLLVRSGYGLCVSMRLLIYRELYTFYISFHNGSV